MANHYHLLIETPKGNFFHRHAPAKRDIHPELQSPSQTRRPFVSSAVQSDPGGKRVLPLELCRYIVLNPVRVKRGTDLAAWKWSSYPGTAGLGAVPEFLSTDWLLEQFGKNRGVPQKRYREFLTDGVASRPWDGLKGQIYLDSDKFIERHTAEARSFPQSLVSSSVFNAC